MCLLMLVSRLLSLVIFGSEAGCLGLEKQAFGKECIAKSTFIEIEFLMMPGLLFSRFFAALGQIFMTFVALENGLRFDNFSERF